MNLSESASRRFNIKITILVDFSFYLSINISFGDDLGAQILFLCCFLLEGQIC